MQLMIYIIARDGLNSARYPYTSVLSLYDRLLLAYRYALSLAKLWPGRLTLATW